MSPATFVHGDVIASQNAPMKQVYLIAEGEVAHPTIPLPALTHCHQQVKVHIDIRSRHLPGQGDCQSQIHPYISLPLKLCRPHDHREAPHPVHFGVTGRQLNRRRCRTHRLIPQTLRDFHREWNGLYIPHTHSPSPIPPPITRPTSRLPSHFKHQSHHPSIPGQRAG